MSKERTSSAESDEQRNEGSDSVLQGEGNTRHAKPTSLSDTTLQDLPIEMLERILVQAVVMEAKDKTTAKRVWKDKAGLVINRLAAVCSQWSSILTTEYFINEVNRVIDWIAQEASRLEILHQYPLQFEISQVTTNKEEIFLLCTHAQGYRDRVIKVYDCNNMTKVKDVILLPRRNAKAIEACMVSNCLYVLFTDSPGVSMFRLTRDAQQLQFNISPWIVSDYEMPYACMSTSANGNVMITSDIRCKRPLLISIYDTNGLCQHKIELLPHVYDFHMVDSVMQKSDGNLVVVAASKEFQRKLMEFDTSGRLLRQYQSSIGGLSLVGLTDNYGRILIAGVRGISLFDCEFNPLEFAALPLDDGQCVDHLRLHYSKARNEIISVAFIHAKFRDGVLITFRLT